MLRRIGVMLAFAVVALLGAVDVAAAALEAPPPWAVTDVVDDATTVLDLTDVATLDIALEAEEASALALGEKAVLTAHEWRVWYGNQPSSVRLGDRSTNVVPQRHSDSTAARLIVLRGYRLIC